MTASDRMHILITDMSRADIPEICRLERECFSSPWSRSPFEEYLSRAGCVFLAAKSDGEIAGYIGMYSVLDEGNITNVAVFDAFRRRGIAEKLISELKSRCRQMRLSFVTLEVRAGNAAAISLYEKCGFERVGSRRNYYDHPDEDAVLMTFSFEKGYKVNSEG